MSNYETITLQEIRALSVGTTMIEHVVHEPQAKVADISTARAKQGRR